MSVEMRRVRGFVAVPLVSGSPDALVLALEVVRAIRAFMMNEEAIGEDGIPVLTRAPGEARARRRGTDTVVYLLEIILTRDDQFPFVSITPFFNPVVVG